MGYTVYILYSTSSSRTYVGYTNDLERRLWEHNHHSGKSFTSRYRPWVVVYTEKYIEKSEAMRREKWFKSGQGNVEKSKILAAYLED